MTVCNAFKIIGRREIRRQFFGSARITRLETEEHDVFSRGQKVRQFEKEEIT